MGMDKDSATVYAGVFRSKEEAEKYMELVDGRPQKFMDDMYLTGEFNGHIVIMYLDKKTNNAETLYKAMPYGDNIVGMLKAMFSAKLKRQVNTAIVIYDFYLGAEHFTGHTAKQMSEKRAENYHIFHVVNIVQYKNPQYLAEHPEFPD